MMAFFINFINKAKADYNKKFNKLWYVLLG